MNDGTGTTLRDTIAEAYNAAETVVAPAEPVVTPAADVAEAPTAPAAEHAEDQKPGRTAGRARDEHGRLLPGPAVRPEPEAAAPTRPETPVPAAPEIARPPRPSSWKKEFWEDWDKLDPRVAEYVNQREGEYAKGVSTYKTEWENARPLLDAIEPFMPTLKQHGIQPDKWISNLGNAHHMLALGSAQEKLQMFQKLAQDYGVPLQALYDPQAAQQFVQQVAAQPQQPQTPPVPVETLVEQKMTELMTRQQVSAFGAAKDAAGNPQYPHFETVRNDMALLLDAGKATDLADAYRKALRMDDTLWEAEQAARAQASETARLESQRAAVAAAKGNAISPRSATPMGQGAGAKKGLRSIVEDAFDTHASGRV